MNAWIIAVIQGNVSFKIVKIEAVLLTGKKIHDGKFKHII
jgi:hypothetical protein